MYTRYEILFCSSQYICYICIYTHFICNLHLKYITVHHTFSDTTVQLQNSIHYTHFTRSIFTLHSCSPTVLSSLARGCLSVREGKEERERGREGEGEVFLGRNQELPPTTVLYILYQFTILLGLHLINTIVTFVQLQNY